MDGRTDRNLATRKAFREWTCLADAALGRAIGGDQAEASCFLTGVLDVFEEEFGAPQARGKRCFSADPAYESGRGAAILFLTSKGRADRVS